MSDAPQGPGWWQASDGRWYPPQSAPTQPAPAPPPGGTPQQPPAGPPVKVSKRTLIIVGLVVLALGVASAAIRGFGSKDDAAAKARADALAEAIVGGKCTVITDAQVRAVFGAGYETLNTSSGLLGEAFNMNPDQMAQAIDRRVIGGAPDCWITPTDATRKLTGAKAPPFNIIRVARFDGKSASARFTQAQNEAKGKCEPIGSDPVPTTGLAVIVNGERCAERYFNKPASLGDESFCTSGTLSAMSGMLVRKGDTLVYVSISPNPERFDYDPTDVAARDGDPLWIEYGSDDAHCETAGKVATEILGL